MVSDNDSFDLVRWVNLAMKRIFRKCSLVINKGLIKFYFGGSSVFEGEILCKI